MIPGFSSPCIANNECDRHLTSARLLSQTCIFIVSISLDCSPRRPELATPIRERSRQETGYDLVSIDGSLWRLELAMAEKERFQSGLTILEQ
jgi:hypothetical protein